MAPQKVTWLKSVVTQSVTTTKDDPAWLLAE